VGEKRNNREGEIREVGQGESVSCNSTTRRPLPRENATGGRESHCERQHSELYPQNRKDYSKGFHQEGQGAPLVCISTN